MVYNNYTLYAHWHWLVYNHNNECGLIVHITIIYIYNDFIFPREYALFKYILCKYILDIYIYIYIYIYVCVYICMCICRGYYTILYYTIL